MVPSLLLAVPSAFGIPVAIGASLGCVAALVALRALRGTASPAVIGACLLGASGVAAQLAVARTAPASRLSFVLGAAGGWCWYVGWQYSEQRAGLAAQTLAVGGLFWVGGAITLAVSFAGSDWPVCWSLALGSVAGAVSVAVSWWHAELDRLDPKSALVVGTFVAPAVIAAVFSAELLFVTFLIAVVVGIIGWSHLRLASDKAD
jgi:hypothetical protein